MYWITIGVNLAAAVVFAALGYKSLLLILAQPKRRRFLKQVQEELSEAAIKMDRRMRKLNGAPERDLVGWLGSKLTRLGLRPTSTDLPARLHPCRLLKRVVLLAAADANDLAIDEVAHYAHRMRFQYSRASQLAAQATKFGLFFTVLGVMLAFLAIASDVDDPGRMIVSLSLALGMAMLTTVIGLLLSMGLNHFVIDGFGRVHQQFSDDLEQWVLILLRDVALVPRLRSGDTNSFDGDLAALPPIHHSASDALREWLSGSNACHERGSSPCVEE